MYAPAEAIAKNCGKNGQWVAEKIAEKTGSWGYNGLTDQFSDLMKDGVLVSELSGERVSELAVSRVTGVLPEKNSE